MDQKECIWSQYVASFSGGEVDLSLVHMQSDGSTETEAELCNLSPAILRRVAAFFNLIADIAANDDVSGELKLELDWSEEQAAP